MGTEPRQAEDHNDRDHRDCEHPTHRAEGNAGTRIGGGFHRSMGGRRRIWVGSGHLSGVGSLIHHGNETRDTAGGFPKNTGRYQTRAGGHRAERPFFAVGGLETRLEGANSSREPIRSRPWPKTIIIIPMSSFSTSY